MNVHVISNNAILILLYSRKNLMISEYLSNIKDVTPRQ